jgi:putative transposase
MHSIPAPASRGVPDFPRVIPLFAFQEGIRKVIYTTNAIESVNMTLRKGTRNHRIFPSDEAAYKVVYVAMRNSAKKWTMRAATGNRPQSLCSGV